MNTKTEDLVCTPEQAIKLKELGVVQCSVFYFGDVKSEMVLLVNNEEDYTPLNSTYCKPITNLVDNPQCVCAFTIVELVPIVKYLAGKPFEMLGIYKEKYKDIDEADLLFRSEFIADMILSALEQKLITVEQINKLLIGVN
ncbi:MAG: hypothetical protein Q7W13_13200 [Bacteroidia bacterium]|nr:hypothetical protein [Bacteroidia bacterium]